MVRVLSLSKDVYQEVQLRKGGLMAVGSRLPAHSRGRAWLRASITTSSQPCFPRERGIISSITR